MTTNPFLKSFEKFSAESRPHRAAFLFAEERIMGIPQILMIILFTIRICVAISTHGVLEADLRRHNAWYDIFANGIIISILYAGGFWD